MNGRATAPKPLRLFRDPTTDQALASRYQPQKQASQNRTPESLCQPQQKHLETEHLNHCANQSSRHLKQNTRITVPTTGTGISNRTPESQYQQQQQASQTEHLRHGTNHSQRHLQQNICRHAHHTTTSGTISSGRWRLRGEGGFRHPSRPAAHDSLRTEQPSFHPSGRQEEVAKLTRRTRVSGMWAVEGYGEMELIRG